MSAMLPAVRLLPSELTTVSNCSYARDPCGGRLRAPASLGCLDLTQALLSSITSATAELPPSAAPSAGVAAVSILVHRPHSRRHRNCGRCGHLFVATPAVGWERGDASGRHGETLRCTSDGEAPCRTSSRRRSGRRWQRVRTSAATSAASGQNLAPAKLRLTPTPAAASTSPPKLRRLLPPTSGPSTWLHRPAPFVDGHLQRHSTAGRSSSVGHGGERN